MAVDRCSVGEAGLRRPRRREEGGWGRVGGGLAALAVARFERSGERAPAAARRRAGCRRVRPVRAGRGPSGRPWPGTASPAGSSSWRSAGPPGAPCAPCAPSSASRSGRSGGCRAGARFSAARSCKKSCVLSRLSSSKPSAQTVRRTGSRTAPWQHAIPWAGFSTSTSVQAHVSLDKASPRTPRKNLVNLG